MHKKYHLTGCVLFSGVFVDPPENSALCALTYFLVELQYFEKPHILNLLLCLTCGCIFLTSGYFIEKIIYKSGEHKSQYTWPK